MNDHEAKAVWQSQATTLPEIYPLYQLQQDVMTFRRVMQRRKLQEICAAVLVMLIFGYYGLVLTEFFMRLGSGLIVLASVVILYQLQCRINMLELPPESLGLPYLLYYRQELERQQKALRHLWLGQICPVVPGIGFFVWGMAQPNPAIFPWEITAVFIVPFAVVFGMNLRTANKIQAELNRLNKEAQGAE